MHWRSICRVRGSALAMDIHVAYTSTRCSQSVLKAQLSTHFGSMKWHVWYNREYAGAHTGEAVDAAEYSIGSWVVCTCACTLQGGWVG